MKYILLLLFFASCTTKKFVVIENIDVCKTCRKQMFHLEAIKDNEVRLEKLDRATRTGDVIILKK